MLQGSTRFHASKDTDVSRQTCGSQAKHEVGSLQRYARTSMVLKLSRVVVVRITLRSGGAHLNKLYCFGFVWNTSAKPVRIFALDLGHQCQHSVASVMLRTTTHTRTVQFGMSLRAYKHSNEIICSRDLSGTQVNLRSNLQITVCQYRK